MERRAQKLGDFTAFSIRPFRVRRPPERFLERYPEMVDFTERLQDDINEWVSSLNTVIGQALAARKE